MTTKTFIEKLELVLNEPGVITRIELTYDCMDKYSARMIGNDSNPENAYCLYADVTCKGEKLQLVLADMFEAYTKARNT